MTADMCILSEHHSMSADETYPGMSQDHQQQISGIPAGRGSERPLVSIVTPNFNYGRFLGETIQSVLGQKYPRIEHIVVDGGSTDDSLDVVRRFGSGVRLIAAPGTGQTESINIGLRAATGEIVGYLNSDDLFFDSDSVQTAVDVLLGDASAWMVYGDLYEIDDESRYLDSISTTETEFLLADSFLQLVNPVCQPGSLMRRRALDVVGYFNETRRYAMDWDYWLRLAAVGRIVHIPRSLSRMRVHSSSKTVRALMSKVDDMLELYDDAFSAAWLPDSCREHEMEVRCLVAGYCIIQCFAARRFARAGTLTRVALRWAVRSRARDLAKLVRESLRHPRGRALRRHLGWLPLSAPASPSRGRGR